MNNGTKIILSMIVVGMMQSISCGAKQEQDKPSVAGQIEKRILRPETLPVATVNGNNISLDLFNRIYRFRIDKLVSVDRLSVAVALHLKQVIANELIEQRLIRSEAEKRNIMVTDKQLADAMTTLMKTFPSQKEYQKYLTTFHGGKNRLHEIIKTRLLAEHLIPVAAVVSDEKARQFYDQHSNLFNIAAHLKIQDIVILVRPDDSLEHKKLLKQKAEDVRAEALKPKTSFAVLARRHSQGPSAKIGGYLGMVTKNTVPPEIWKNLTILKPLEVSKVIEAKDGFHILKLIKRNPRRSRAFENAKQDIKVRILSRRKAAKISALKTRLRTEAKIKNHLDIRYQEMLAKLRKEHMPSKRVVGNAEGINGLPLNVPIKTDRGLASNKSEGH